MSANTQNLITRINRKDWWHVTPVDPDAYKKRGKFLASTYARAEFWGRPNDQPEKVCIASPLVGDEELIERKLFGKTVSHPEISVEKRFVLDARMRRAALKKGFDSIVLMGKTSYERYLKEGKIPLSIELNVVDLRCLIPANGTHRGNLKTE
jgi:hypothetical protein